MRAYDLIKETFNRKLFILIVHLSWLALYGMFYWLRLPDAGEVSDFARFIFIWGGFFLALALSAGIFGDDISSGRICVLVTKPFWLGELYIYRLLGLSLQAAVHFIMAWFVIFILHIIMRKGSINNLGLWLFASWLLFNTCAALSTSLSVVVRRALNSMLLFVVIGFTFFFASLLETFFRDHTAKVVLQVVLRYTCPPIELLVNMATGKYSLIQSLACVMHSLVLTAFYSIVGIIILIKRQFACESD